MPVTWKYRITCKNTYQNDTENWGQWRLILTMRTFMQLFLREAVTLRGPRSGWLWREPLNEQTIPMSNVWNEAPGWRAPRSRTRRWQERGRNWAGGCLRSPSAPSGAQRVTARRCLWLTNMQLLGAMFLLVKKTVYRLRQIRSFPVTFCENEQMEIPAQLDIIFINTKSMSRMTSRSVTQRLSRISENQRVPALCSASSGC